MFRKKEEETMNICAVPFCHVKNTLNFNQTNCDPQLPIIPFDIIERAYQYSFVGKRFSKQLHYKMISGQ